MKTTHGLSRAAFALLVGLTTFCRPTFAAEFEFVWTLPTPQGNALHGLAFRDASFGLAVGAKGAVLRTTDAGVSWENLLDFENFSATLKDVVSASPGSWIAVGASPGIFRSTDDGASWSAIVNPSSGTLEDVEFAGTDLVAVGAGGQVLRSTNAGMTWSAAANAEANILREQHWTSALTGVVVGNQVARRTTNGGSSWSTLSGVTETSDFFNEAFSPSAGTILLMADFRYAKSTNGGASWDFVFQPSFPVYRSKTVALSAQHLLVSTHVEGAEIWESTDGGVEWEPLLQRFDIGGFHELVRLSSGLLVTISSDGDLLRSVDDGVTWTNATLSPADDPKAVISSITRLPGGRAFAGPQVGGGGAARWHRSDDGGSNWFEAPGPLLWTVEDLAFWDDEHGLCGGISNGVQFTADGGVTWATASLPNSIPNGVRAYDVDAVAPGIAFAAADGQSGALVFRTTDFGATWEQRSSGIPTSTGWLGSVSFLDATTGFAAGGTTNQPRVWKTTDGGGSWATIGTTGLASFLNDVHFFDASTGVVTMANTGVGVFRTTNGGASWQSAHASSTRRLSFHGDFGVATNGGILTGTVIVTEDAGATWQTVDLPADRADATVLATAEGFFCGGYGSQILHAVNVNATGAPDLAASPAFSDDAAITLRAAPNVGRVIEVTLAARRTAAYSLELVDVAGRRMRSLGAGGMDAGTTRRFPWDGRTDAGTFAAPGVYFARLVVEDEARAVTIHLIR